LNITLNKNGKRSLGKGRCGELEKGRLGEKGRCGEKESLRHGDLKKKGEKLQSVESNQ